MSGRQKVAVLGLWLGLWMGLGHAPGQGADSAMQASVARQAEAIARMQISIEKQRAALRAAHPESAAGGGGTFFTIPFTPSSRPSFALSWPALGAGCDPLPEAELTPLIQKAAQHEGLDASLLRAVAEQESGFRSCAISLKGAMGLMQLMPATVQELGVRDPFDPAESLLSGAHFLKQLLGRFGGDTALALGAYNAGPERVEESGGVPQIPETLRYVQQILSKLPIP